MPRRPTTKPGLTVPAPVDPLEFLRAVVADPKADMVLRIRAARSLMPYVHETTRRRSRKATQEEAAVRALRSLPSARAPSLAVVSNKAKKE
jgi:hypothetical protein